MDVQRQRRRDAELERAGRRSCYLLLAGTGLNDGYDARHQFARSGSGPRLQSRDELVEREAAVRDAILLRRVELGSGDAKCRQEK